MLVTLSDGHTYFSSTNCPRFKYHSWWLIIIYCSCLRFPRKKSSGRFFIEEKLFRFQKLAFILHSCENFIHYRSCSCAISIVSKPVVPILFNLKVARACLITWGNMVTAGRRFWRNPRCNGRDKIPRRWGRNFFSALRNPERHDIERD